MGVNPDGHGSSPRTSVTDASKVVHAPTLGIRLAKLLRRSFSGIFKARSIWPENCQSLMVSNVQLIGSRTAGSDVSCPFDRGKTVGSILESARRGLSLSRRAQADIWQDPWTSARMERR